MSHSITLKKGAFLIGDAHFSHLRLELLDFIKAIHSKKLKPTQLILMGDIMDALFGAIEYTIKSNAEMVRLLNEISDSIEIIYLEGNHDFNLKELFPKARVFSMQNQPLLCSYEGRSIALAHGDFDAPFGYRLYSTIIRNSTLLKILNFIDRRLKDRIIKKIDSYLSKKEDCREFVGFREFIERRALQKYGVDFFIEGHFHQNSSFVFEKYSYINLAAFACNQRYFIVKSTQDKELLEEKIFSKER